MSEAKKNNYAFEIRFVDDKVQVFDIAAKRQNEGTGLPTEYLQEDVLKGQLRYSKLVGSTASPIENQDEYQHQVTTKRSKNRRSIQRHTFFMMGGGGGGGGGDDHSYHHQEYLTSNNSREDHRPHRVVSQKQSPPSSPTLSAPRSSTMSTPSTLPMSPTLSVSPSLPVSPTLRAISPSLPPVSPSLQPVSPRLQPTMSSPIRAMSPTSPTSSISPTSQPISPTLPTPPTSSPFSPPQPAIISSSASYGKNAVNNNAYQYQYNTPEMNQILPSIPPPQECYHDEFAAMVDSYEYSSKVNIQQEKIGPKSGACCIIQ